MVTGMYSYETYASSKSQEKSEAKTSKPRGNVGYFKLIDDGDEALVRFVYDDPKELVIAHVHDEPVGNNKHRRVLCLRENARDDMAKCPFCARGDKYLARVYLKLVEYTKDEKGNIVAQAKIWERPAGFADTIAEYITNYGGLKEVVFKIKRKGIRGNTDTSYILTPMPSTVYNEASGYVKDFHDFENFSFYPHSFLSKTKEDIEEYIKTGEFPFHKKEESTSVTTPTTTTKEVVEEYPMEEPAPEVKEEPKVVTTPTSSVTTSTTTQSGDSDSIMNRPRRRYDYK